jgi:hypothetical protein
MKRFYIIFAVAVLLFGSCEKAEYNMYTKINTDGSCYREICTTADSVFMVGDTVKCNPLPILLDKYWIISWQYITPEVHTNWPVKNWRNDTIKKDEKVSITVGRNYNSVEEMGSNFRFNNISWGKLNIKYNFEKKFRWFYTYYCYSEVYPEINKFKKIPLSKYLSNEEVEIYFKGNTFFLEGLNGEEMLDRLKNISKSVNIWLNRNLYEESYQILSNNLNLLENYSVSKTRFLSIKDSVYNTYICKVLNKEEPVEFGSELDPIKALDYYLKTNAFSKMESKNDTFLKNEFEHIDLFTEYFNKELNYSLEMPGKIINTNSKIYDGNKIIWKIDAYRFAVSDYKIYADSRKANVWAFIVSGIVLVLALFSIFWRNKQ